jgi:Ca2+-binding EF-hand superfamily protein
LTKKQQDDSLLQKLDTENMKRFHKSKKIKQVALMAIAVQSDPKDIEDLKNIFQELDKDGNGSITLEEL